MNILKSFFSFTLSLILVLGLFIFQLSLFTHSKLYNNNMYIRNFENLNLYKTIETSINKDFSNLAHSCNLPLELFNNTISQEWLKSESQNSIKNFTDFMTYKTNTLYSIDSKPQENILTNNINNFIKNSNFKMDKATENELNNIKQSATNLIITNISPIDVKTILISSSFEKIRKNLNYLYSYRNHIILFLIFITMILLVFHRKNIYNFIRWLGFSFIAGGLITLIPSLLCIFYNLTNNLAIGIPLVKLLIGSIVKEFISFFLFSGVVVFSLGLLLVFLSLYYEKYLLNSNRIN